MVSWYRINMQLWQLYNGSLFCMGKFIENPTRVASSLKPGMVRALKSLELSIFKIIMKATATLVWNNESFMSKLIPSRFEPGTAIEYLKQKWPVSTQKQPFNVTKYGLNAYQKICCKQS